MSSYTSRHNKAPNYLPRFLGSIKLNIGAMNAGGYQIYNQDKSRSFYRWSKVKDNHYLVVTLEKSISVKMKGAEQ